METIGKTAARILRREKSSIRETGLAIQPSPIAGRGVFAQKSFRAGDILYSSVVTDVRPAPILGSVQRSADEHVLEPDVLRWVNHSCLPNAVVAFVANRVNLTAATDIHPGDEILCDYRLTESAIPLPFRCNCGNCAGRWIGDAK